MSTLNSLVLSGSTYDLTSGPVPEVVKEALKVEDIVLSEDAFEDAYGEEALEAIKALSVINNSAHAVEQRKEEAMEVEQIIKVALGSRALRISRSRLEEMGEGSVSNLKLLGQELTMEDFTKKATKGLVGAVLVRVASLVPEPKVEPESTGWRSATAQALLKALSFSKEVGPAFLDALLVEHNPTTKSLRFKMERKFYLANKEASSALLSDLRRAGLAKGFKPQARPAGWYAALQKS